ncbi:Asp/Glu/hydantoin racemase [Loktanella sp. PT4BL]|jgi:Asp/Glu/hydantoin racemase|uniref:aspartate/glutamate racemase family protein n=1 Tax=Loktanella sp. PT4BL TaxID=2135611 RepID=UPI000D751019|nr:aspartate/glutamate racemase family protein [Loktanella sp. PT4BL]PXW70701.1 Asp/Glu/hydantoin racemase [Loktanella sp. PT4BL]
MRLLIINPNTSKGVTERIREAANAAAEPDDHFTTICPSFGPELIVTPQDAELASRAVVETVKAYNAPCDGIVLASFGNTGAEEVRALRPDVPVIGIATAAFAVAGALGGPFGIVTFGQSLVPGLTDKAKEAGVGGQLIGVDALAINDFGDPGTVQCRYRRELGQLCSEMQQRGATSIVMGGGPLAGLAAKIGAHCPVPLIDGTSSAISIIRSATLGTSPQ